MKKSFKLYAYCWLIAFALFNVAAFIGVGGYTGWEYSASFWVGYGLIDAAFIGNLICAEKAFEAENLTKLFYSIPLITVSYTALMLSFVIGIICMLVPSIPYWVGIVVCCVVLGVYSISVFGAKGAADTIADVDVKLKSKTSFIKGLTVDASNLMNSASDEKVKKLCSEVFEAIRYSDPMSSDGLSDIENQISDTFKNFEVSVKEGNNEKAASLAGDLVTMLKNRNQKCKLLK